MSADEAENVIAWIESNLTVTIDPWQKQILSVLIRYPDMKFDVRIPRAGRGC